MSNAARRFLSELTLIDACRQIGCPVCRCVENDGRRHLDAMLWEQVTDPETRGRLRRSWGFCNWHARMALDLPGARMAMAIIYDDVLARVTRYVREVAADPKAPRSGWLDRLGQRIGVRRDAPRDDLVPERLPCPICETSADAERRHLDSLLRIDDDADLAAAYNRSDGVCARHLLMAMERDEARTHAAVLAERTAKRWDVLAETVRGFIDKHDHRNTRPFSEAEIEACERALDIVSGRTRVWGNDLHST